MTEVTRMRWLVFHILSNSSAYFHYLLSSSIFYVIYLAHLNIYVKSKKRT